MKKIGNIFLRPQVQKSYLGSNFRYQSSESGTKSKGSSHVKAFFYIKGAVFYKFVKNVEKKMVNEGVKWKN